MVQRKNVDLVRSFPTSIYLQNLASIQPRTSPIISRFRALGNLNLNFEVSKRLFAAQSAFALIVFPSASRLASATVASASFIRELTVTFPADMPSRDILRYCSEARQDFPATEYLLGSFLFLINNNKEPLN